MSAGLTINLHHLVAQADFLRLIGDNIGGGRDSVPATTAGTAGAPVPVVPVSGTASVMPEEPLVPVPQPATDERPATAATLAGLRPPIEGRRSDLAPLIRADLAGRAEPGPSERVMEDGPANSRGDQHPADPGEAMFRAAVRHLLQAGVLEAAGFSHPAQAPSASAPPPTTFSEAGTTAGAPDADFAKDPARENAVEGASRSFGGLDPSFATAAIMRGPHPAAPMPGEALSVKTLFEEAGFSPAGQANLGSTNDPQSMAEIDRAEIDVAETSVRAGTTQEPLGGPLSRARSEGPLVPAYGADSSIQSAAVDGLTAFPTDVLRAREAGGGTTTGDERALDLPEAAHGTFGFPLPATFLGESDAPERFRRLAAVGFGGEDLMPPPSVERAGFIASFILNAAMIPGWPPPRAIEGAPLRDVFATFTNARTLTKSDLELLLYLASLGFSRAHIARLLKALDDRKRRSRLMKAIAVIMTNVGALLEAFRQEIERRQEEAADELRLKTPGGRAKIGV